MQQGSATATSGEGRLLAWLPLLAGVFASYGPVGFNYGFALYFLTYRHGFVKRGLLGQVLSGVHFFTRTQLLGLEYAFLAAGFAFTYAVFRPVIFGEPAERRLAAVLLSAPAALPHLGYLFAQPDIALYLLVLASFALFLRADARLAAVLSLPLCCLGLMAHEAFLLMFYPAVLAIMLAAWHKGRLPLPYAVLHAALVLACFAAVLHWGTLKVTPDLILREAQARSAVPLQRQVYDVLASDLATQRILVHRMYSPGVMRILWITLALSAPYFLMLVRLLQGSMRAAALSIPQRLFTAALLLAPLPLCTLGHDTTRWIGAMCLDASLYVLFLYLQDAPEGPVRCFLRNWAAKSEPLAWLAYLVLIGPYGATGIRTAEQFVSAWYGP